MSNESGAPVGFLKDAQVIIDAQALDQAAGNALGYYIIGSSLNAVLWAGYMHIKRPDLMRTLFTTEWKLTLGGGGASFAAYALVVWAFMSAPIALVTALRETSIVFAMLLGVLVLGERLSWQKVLSVVLTIGGVILLRFSFNVENHVL